MDKQTFWNDLTSGKFAQMVKETASGNQLSSSQETYNIIRPMIDTHQDIEKMYGIFANGQNEILKLKVLATGSLGSSSVYPREIVKDCLEYQAASLILAHNHPSGHTEPSNEDKLLTKTILFATKLVGTTLLDHVVIGAITYYSFADDGLLRGWSDEFDSIFKKSYMD